MKKRNSLLVTAKYGSLEFSETAWPYNEKAHNEQIEDCIDGIVQQIVDAGREEMLDAFQLQKPQIIEEYDEGA